MTVISFLVQESSLAFNRQGLRDVFLPENAAVAIRTSMLKPDGGVPHSQYVAPQGCVLIGLRLPDVLFPVTDSISLLVCPSPIAIGFSLCLQGGGGDGSLSHLWIEVATASLKVKIECRSSGKVRREAEVVNVCVILNQHEFQGRRGRVAI
jgi:hypothetical protein